ncbi:MAG: FAD-dependent oxidoreductase [Deltaproteobacteria bacterium]|nr:FAD-dependent oxidoreductase [Deltaproteobacteria bacterium]
MHKRYSDLLSPLKVGNTVFRNRLFSAPTGLHALQGNEPYPTEAIMETFAARARGGAAMVTLHGISPFPGVSDGEHLSYDIYTAHSRHYLAQLGEMIHFYGAKASMEILGDSKNPDYSLMPGKAAPLVDPLLEMPEDIMDEIAENYAYQAEVMKYLGYDMVLVHMAYRMSIGARFLSPATNKRTDKYGGSVENRARFPIMVFDRIKERCGKDFLIELRMSGAEPGPDGITIEDSIKLAGLLEGRVDLLQVHAGDFADTHPMGFRPRLPNLGLAEAIKKGGATIPVVTIGGNQDLDESEDIIASGKADFISIARGWIADPALGTKAYEGRGEDVVPCIQCMRCHDSACLDNRTYVCSVNPAIGLEHRLEKIVKLPRSKRKIAVVGGGPAGMEAAIIAADRGHDVTLYEMSGALGGQLLFSDYVSFKSSLSKFKRYLVRQIEKSKVRVFLNTKAAAGLLEKGGFDVVIGALGAEPLAPAIPGVERGNVITAPKVYGNEDSLDHKVLILGAGQVGCETALHLAMSGHEVTMMEMQERLAPDASTTYRGVLLREIRSNKNLRYILKARCTAVGDKVIFYKDADGNEKRIEAESVVIATGMKGRLEEAMALWNTADRFVMIGDCSEVGNVEKAMRSAFSSAIVL